MQETSEWDRLTRGCAAPRQPQAQISSSVEGSATVMLLSGDSGFQLCSLNSASAAETFLFPPRGLALVLQDLFFFFFKGVFISQKCLSASAAVAHLTVGFVFELCNRGGSC